MGLDMYLSAKRYLWQHRDEDQQIANVIKAEQIGGMGNMRVKELVCEAMYWRKANAIHKWFVDNVQDGEDDCKQYEVSAEQLRELIALCDRVLTERGKATELLPPCEGFFFGSSDIDEGYWGDLVATQNMLTTLLNTEGIDNWYFTYQSSW